MQLDSPSFERIRCFFSCNSSPANLLSVCCQLREEIFCLMEDSEKIPRLEIYILRQECGLWEIGVAWSVPPSACAQFCQWSMGHMDIGLKPRNNAEFVAQAQASGELRAYSTSRMLWHDELLRRIQAGDVLGYLASRAVQRLRTGQAMSKSARKLHTLFSTTFHSFALCLGCIITPTSSLSLSVSIYARTSGFQTSNFQRSWNRAYGRTC